MYGLMGNIIPALVEPSFTERNEINLSKVTSRDINDEFGENVLEKKMSAWFIDEKTLNRITSIISNPNSSIIDLIKEDTIKTAIKRQVPKLLDFILKHVGEFVDVAIGVIKTSVVIQKKALDLLLSNMQPFTNQIQNSPEFASHIYAFISQEADFSEVDSTCFCKLIEFYMKDSDCGILNKLPKDKFIPLLLSRVHHLSISNLMEIITCDTRKSMWKYIENTRVDQVIYNSFGNIDYINERLLNFFRNIICSAELGSPVLDLFTKKNSIARFFDFGYNATTHVAAAAFRVVYEVLGLVIYEEESEMQSNILFGTIFAETAENLEALCEFVQQDRPFLDDKYRAIELITAILQVYPDPEPCVVDMMKYLFKKFMELPFHTFLHQSFYNVMLKIGKDDKSLRLLIKKLNMYEEIIKAFDGYDHKQVSYIGHLYAISNYISKKLGPDPENEEWNKFLEDKISQMRDVISKPFGGMMPNQYYQDDDDDDYVTPREAAISIFGKAFFFGGDDDEFEEEDFLDDDYDEEEL